MVGDDTKAVIKLAALEAVAQHQIHCPQERRIVNVEQEAQTLAGTLYGDDKAGTSGLKGCVTGLKIKMGFIQWLTAAITIAVIVAVADRFINKPATDKGLADINITIQEAADRAAKTAAKTAVEMIRSNKETSAQ